MLRPSRILGSPYTVTPLGDCRSSLTIASRPRVNTPCSLCRGSIPKLKRSGGLQPGIFAVEFVVFRSPLARTISKPAGHSASIHTIFIPGMCAI